MKDKILKKLKIIVPVITVSGFLVACNSTSIKEPETQVDSTLETPTSQSGSWSISPPASLGGPTNPPISSDMAVQSALDHLSSIGINNPHFNYIYMDSEDGRWVWSVEFSNDGKDLEFYVDVNTGELLKAPNETNSVSSDNQDDNDRASSNLSTSPTISRNRAAEIAQGIVSGRLIEVDHDFERGREVWYVAINSNGRIHEIYVDIMTGDIVLHESYSDD